MSHAKRISLFKVFYRLLFAGLVIASVSVLVVCTFFRVYSPSQIEAYQQMSIACHPVWQSLALREFSSGDSAQDLLEQFVPSRSDEFGRYGVYKYYKNPEIKGIHFTGVTVVTKDERLLTAQAHSCTWDFTFFETEDANLEAEYSAYLDAKYAAYMQELIEEAGEE